MFRPESSWKFRPHFVVMVSLVASDGGFGKAQVVVAVLIGLMAGLSLFTFRYARAGSYLTDDPAACANCHVMQEQYTSWLKGSHRAVAVCNDCHTPAGFVGKYATKAKNGVLHSAAFTLHDFPDVIQIKPGSRELAEQACQKCHEQITSSMAMTRVHAKRPACLQCHARVGHM
jgi:cytochrome c nitrite reductase small subunit